MKKINGLSRVKQSSGTTENLYSVSAVSAACECACGEGGTIIYTLHGGSNVVNTIYVNDDYISGVKDVTIDYTFNTVMEAIDAALPGDSIYIFTGEYLETTATTTCSSNTHPPKPIPFLQNTTCGITIRQVKASGVKPGSLRRAYRELRKRMRVRWL